MKSIAAWQNFYVIVGSSAGALIGLQFVVLSLIANKPTVRVDPQTGGAFSTPTIIHFSAVLVLAALLSAPWEGIDAPMIVCGVFGLAGAIYSAIVIMRLRRQTRYRLEFEDWMFYALLPLIAYALLIASAVLARLQFERALFGVGGSALLLLLIGIHNAWDTVTYHVFTAKKEP